MRTTQRLATECPPGHYVAHIDAKLDGNRLVLVAKIDVPESIKMRLRMAGWKQSSRGHMVHPLATLTSTRVVFGARVVKVQILGQERDKRGRRSRITVARAFYSQVAFFEDGGLRIGGHKL